MGTPAADRQRRSRAHRKGDHSLCDPERCDGTTPVTPVTAAVTRKLGARGRELWDALDGPKLAAGERVLLEEICRSADRLDQLDRILRGDEDAWLRFRSLNDDGSIVKVVVNDALSEARQQQAVLKQMLGELRQSRGVKQQPRSAPGGKGVAGVIDLVAAAASRSAKSAG